MEEDTEFMKLPIEERCVHKAWKARISGYEEAAKLFRQIDDEKSPEFGKYLGLVKKFVVDSNAIAQEKGLEAVLAYVENYALAGKTVGEVMSGIVAKCLAAPKAKTKDLAGQVTLMYIEIEKQEPVQEELLKGLEHKNPKLVSSCVSTFTQALREFGIKVINVKPLIKKIHVLLEDRDKSVRDEGKAMIIEIYRWIGAALKPQLSSLKPVQLTELESEFEKVSKEKPVPTRFLRSEQQKQAIAAASAVDEYGECDDEGDEADGVPEVDVYDIMDPVDILSKLPKDFYENIEKKKWQERKEAVDALKQLVKDVPKLESGDYGDLVRALKKIISKDTNVVVVVVAGECLAHVANGLKRRFQPYAGACIPAILEKFREKKQNVVETLKKAIDAIFISTSIEAIQEDVLAAFENKNPNVKAETASFLARCFTRCTPVMLNKKLLKAYTTALLKTLNEPDPTVRDRSAEALGAAMKAAGEKAIMPFLTDVDNMKMTKIKECCEKTVMLVKAPKERPNTAPAKSTKSESSNKPANKAQAKRSSSAGPNKPAAQKKPSERAGDKKTVAKITEKELSMDEIEDRANDLLSPEVVRDLADSNYKVRLSAVEQVTQKVNSLSPSEIDAQVLIGILNKKPGLKDTNVQVAKARIEAVKMIAEVATIPSFVLEQCVADITDKLGDAKNSQLAAETLLALAEATKLSLVASAVLSFSFNQKNPKVQQEALTWVGNAILNFGLLVQPKVLMENIKKALNATNPVIRNSAINLIGTLYIYIGDDLRMYFENEKPALLQLINAEFEKQAGITPPSPTRGRPSKDSQERNEDNSSPEPVNIRELMPRVDISPHITDDLVTELANKNCKARTEAIEKLSGILEKERFITSNLGELPPVLAKRLVDSNANIAAAAIRIVEQLGVAMGSQCKTHVRAFLPGLLQSMGDSKPRVRTAATQCINAWGEQCGYKEFFDGEMFADSLKSGSPVLRAELWCWLAEKIPTVPVKSIPKDELLACMPILFSNLEDRNVEVRKNAQEAVLGFLIHLGYDTMMRATEKLTPASQNTVRIVLEKVYPNVPEKPAQRKKDAAGGSNEDSEQSRGIKGSQSKSNLAKGTAKSKAGASKTIGRKKDDDSDSSPLLQTNNLKTQRSIDEHKLKVLKWNFTTPREEFVELLKDQMTAANVNKNLITNMFHADFKYHLKAIDALSEDLPCNPSATLANLDLILKWMTLRFFDTNPSVLIKGLEYLQTVFDTLIKEEYNMFENEASSFIPYLILKSGDPKDAVRNSVRALFKQIRNMYPASKLFTYIMDGLKSKNARQRTECLDILGSLIEGYGMTVCQPSPAAAMKEVAKQISDRDNSVRNAALNCIVQAYFLEGDKIYKMIGQISDKDLSLLEERIKRASKNRPVSRSVPPPVTRQAPPPKLTRQGSDSAIPKQEEYETSSPVMGNDATVDPHYQDEVVNDPGFYSNDQAASRAIMDLDTVNYAEPSPPKPRPVSGPYGLDTHLLEKIEGVGINICAPKLHEFNFEEILGSDHIHMPSAEEVSLKNTESPNNRVTSSKPSLIVNPQKATLTFGHRNVDQENIDLRNTTQITNQSLDLAITNVASPNHAKFRAAANQLDHLLQSPNASIMLDHADQLIVAVVMQLRMLSDSVQYSSDIEEVSAGFRLCFMLLLTFYQYEELPKKVSKDVLRDLVEHLLNLLVEQKMEKLVSCDQYIRVINLIVVKIIEKSDLTNIVCALITMLHDSFRSTEAKCPRYVDLVMKCLWKVVRLLPKHDEQLDYDEILLHIHKFFKEYPSSMWRKQKADTPIRTIKTLLHTMTKVKGAKIMNHLSKINNKSESELVPYIEKLLKSFKQETKKLKPQHRLSKTSQDLLSEIFMKIGCKEETKEGLKLLYDFREQHPEADIEPFLQKSSQFFQDYIQKGLQNIEEERKKINCGVQPSLTATTSMSSLGILDSCGTLTPSSECGDTNLEKSDDTKSQKNRNMFVETEDMDSGVNPSYFLERLRSLQKNAGLDPTSDLIVGKQSNPISDMNLVKRRVHDNKETAAMPRPVSMSATEVDELKKRLAAVRTQPR